MSSQVWLITGTSCGFGRRLAKSALARGDRVIATGRTAKRLEEIVQECDPQFRANLRTLELDVTEGEASLKEKASKAAEMWGRIDVLVNNAGVGYPGLLEEGGSTLLRKQFETNVFGLMDVTTAFLPYLRASGQGTLVVIGSRSSWKTELLGIGPYAASKAAVHALTETLSIELAPFNIRVLLVAPGAFRTEGIYRQDYFTQNPLPVYDQVRETSVKRFASVPGSEKGDPDKAMEAVVDVVRGEGVAKGRPWPKYLIMGEDAGRDVQAKCTEVLSALEEWKDVTNGVSFD